MNKLLIILAGVFALGGCQLTQLVKDAGPLETKLKKQHALAALELNEEFDSYLSDRGRAQLLSLLAKKLKQPAANESNRQDPITHTQWTLKVDALNFQAFQLKRAGKEKINTESELMFVDLPYVTRRKIQLYTEPTRSSDELGTLEQGNIVNVLAQTPDENWYLIERGTHLLGYVRKTAVNPSIVKRDFLNSRPYELKVDTDNDLTRDGYVLPLHDIFGLTQCRQVNISFTHLSRQSQRSLNLCQKTPDIWFINPLHDTPGE